MSAPTSQLRLSKWMRVNLPKRLELLFIAVLALPKASRIGLQPSTFSESCASVSDARRSSESLRRLAGGRPASAR